jgi:hypothetical protein
MGIRKKAQFRNVASFVLNPHAIAIKPNAATARLKSPPRMTNVPLEWLSLVMRVVALRVAAAECAQVFEDFGIEDGRADLVYA